MQSVDLQAVTYKAMHKVFVLNTLCCQVRLGRLLQHVMHARKGRHWHRTSETHKYVFAHSMTGIQHAIRLASMPYVVLFTDVLAL